MKRLEFVLFIIIFVYSVLVCSYNYYNKSSYIHFVSKHKESIDKIYNNVNLDVNTNLNSKHCWNEEIDNGIKTEILQINDEILGKLDDGFRYIPSMTELYYSSKGNQNSDKQFVDSHTDGPFYACNVYRALVVVNGNKNIDTYFPNIDKVVTLQKYDIVLFDYNNEFHYIDVNNSDFDNSQRIIIKLHYVKSNNKLCEKYHCEYGRHSREIFEFNKTDTYISGVFARLTLYYNTYRKYILFIIFGLLLLLLYYHDSKGKNKFIQICIRCIIYIFMMIEIFGILYTLHFHFLSRDVCKHDHVIHH